MAAGPAQGLPAVRAHRLCLQLFADTSVWFLGPECSFWIRHRFRWHSSCQLCDPTQVTEVSRLQFPHLKDGNNSNHPGKCIHETDP